jgi:hypothetical protein
VCFLTWRTAVKGCHRPPVDCTNESRSRVVQAYGADRNTS